jgi:hypothetical protein
VVGITVSWLASTVVVVTSTDPAHGMHPVSGGSKDKSCVYGTLGFHKESSSNIDQTERGEETIQQQAGGGGGDHCEENMGSIFTR